jgi:hypothetical protein
MRKAFLGLFLALSLLLALGCDTQEGTKDTSSLTAAHVDRPDRFFGSVWNLEEYGNIVASSGDIAVNSARTQVAISTNDSLRHPVLAMLDW